MTIKKNIRLESERLLLQTVTLDDCTETYLAWLNDPAVVEYTDGIFYKHSMESMINFVALQNAKSNAVFLSIRIKDNNKHIGNIKIDQIHPYHKAGEYGIMMGDKTELGKGYGFEASVMIINYCFDEVGLGKISLTVADANKTALALYQKLGFQIEGVLRESFYHLPSKIFLNGIKMGLLKPEWKFLNESTI
jgi:ribosomal-protein-alanine N-acetyltransferase